MFLSWGLIHSFIRLEYKVVKQMLQRCLAINMSGLLEGQEVQKSQ